MLVDLSFEDNPWWFDRFKGVGRLLDFEGKGIQKIWSPRSVVSIDDAKFSCQRWADRYGNFSVFLVDLSRSELMPDSLEDLLEFYYTRMFSTSSRRLIVVYSAQWIGDVSIFNEYMDENTTVALIYTILKEKVDRIILRANDNDFPEISNQFWSGNLDGILRFVDKRLKVKLERKLWKDIIGFPREYEDTLRLYSCVNEINGYYEIREKVLLRKFLSFIVENHAEEFVYRDTAEKLDIRFETLKNFLDYFYSGGILYEISEIGSSTRSHRRIFISNGRFYNSLRHLDNKSLLQTSENEIKLRYLLPYITSASIERGFEVFFKSENPLDIVLKKGEFMFSVPLMDIPPHILAGV